MSRVVRLPTATSRKITTASNISKAAPTTLSTTQQQQQQQQQQQSKPSANNIATGHHQITGANSRSASSTSNRSTPVNSRAPPEIATGSATSNANLNSTTTSTTSATYKGVDCLAKRRQLSRWLRQVSSGVQALQLNQTSDGQQQQPLRQQQPQVNQQRELNASSGQQQVSGAGKQQQQQHQQSPADKSISAQQLICYSDQYDCVLGDRNQDDDDDDIENEYSEVQSQDNSTNRLSQSTWHLSLSSKAPKLAQHFKSQQRINLINNSKSKHQLNSPKMATVRPISPQYQHALDSAISLAKELASRNMADSGESSPKTPNSPDKKSSIFNFKLKHFSKSFSEASANIRDIESSISYEAKQAYDSLVERGPYNSYRYNENRHYTHHHTIGHSHHHHNYHHNQYANDEFSPSFSSPHNKLKHVSASTFSVKKSLF